MKLAKYLADYIEHEIGETDRDGLTVYYETIIQQGIEAFESTKQVRVTIVDASSGEMPWKEGMDINITDRCQDKEK